MRSRSSTRWREIVPLHCCGNIRKKNGQNQLHVIGSVLLGAILGRFFKVLVLLPAFALSLAIVLASSAYFGHSLSRTFIELVALVVSLQLGYVSGLLSSFIRNLRPIHPESPPGP